MIFRILNALFNGPAWRAFVAMGVFVSGFALCSFRLLDLFMANFDLIRRYGAMAVFDGGGVQLFELIGWGYLALGFYVLFKGCLDGLMRRFHMHLGH